jgi:hypothetical protein
MSARLPWTRGAVVLHVVGGAMILGGALVQMLTQSRGWRIGFPLYFLSVISLYISHRLRRDAAEAVAAERGQVRWL